MTVVDDGSGAIDCNLRHFTHRQLLHEKLQKDRQPVKVQHNQSSFPNGREPPPTPLARLGDIVRVTGRVLNRHDTRMINVERLGT